MNMTKKTLALKKMIDASLERITELQLILEQEEKTLMLCLNEQRNLHAVPVFNTREPQEF